MPKDETHHDEHFGDVVILRNDAELRFRPISGTPPTSLRVRHRGCAEGKVCYTVRTRLVSAVKP